MSFKSCIDQMVLIVTKTGEEFFGVVEDYFYPDDNECGIESIVMKTPEGYLIEFTQNEIETIETV